MNVPPAQRIERGTAPGRSGGFTVLEVLVVLAIVSMLVAMLLPGLSAAREQGRAIVCRSNVSQIMLANRFYAEDSNGVYVPGAADFRRNLQRWHGRRDHAHEAFDSSRGPLAKYLGPDAAIRQCPTFTVSEIAENGGFERGNGGYGYNNAYVGVQLEPKSNGGFDVRSDRAGVVVDRITRPADTLMFADSAFVGSIVIEYSFVEPRFHVSSPARRMDPSIQFRHNGVAVVGWCDGHVDTRSRTFSWSSGWYRGNPSQFDVGWFGDADDNSLFDLN